MKFISGIFILFFAAFLISSGSVHAQDNGEIRMALVLKGSKNGLKKDSVVLVKDSLASNPAYESLINMPYPVKNVITLRIRQDSFYVQQPFSAKVRFNLTYWNANKQANSIDTSLEVNFNPATNTLYTTRSSLIFSGAYAVRVKLIEDVIISGTTQPNLQNVLELENLIISRPDYAFNCDNNTLKKIKLTTDPVPEDELEVSWANVWGATEYDLEWCYIDSSALLSGRYQGYANNPDKLFRNNATRITTTGNLYRIPLIYDTSGVVFIRVRPVQTTTGKRIEVRWSSDFSNGLGAFGIKGHEPSLNWQSAITFAEDGKRKMVVQYYDGSLRNRQTVTKDNVTNTTIVAETFYDYQGRPVIQVLPAPTVNSIISYSKNFNIGLNGSEYDKDQYDFLTDPAAYCGTGAAPMKTSSGASQYYSSANPNKAGMNKFIASAHQYPFTETEYTQDNTGRVSKQSGVDSAFKLGSGHETTYYYGGAPDQKELDALFGTEVGDHNHYKKNMVRDANGQLSVSYLDMNNRVIATALAGLYPANVDSLSSYTSDSITEKLIDATGNSMGDMAITSRKSLLVSAEGLYNFKYDLDPDKLRIKDCNQQNICYDFLYDLKITITDDCNNQKLGGKPFDTLVYNFNPWVFDKNSKCKDSGFHVTFSKYLAVGNYEITKTLSINKERLEFFRDSIFIPANTCITLDSMIKVQFSLLERTDCMADPLADTLTGNDGDIRQAMLLDMTAPSGQYANPLDPDIFSIFYTPTEVTNPTKLFIPYQNKNLVYLNESGQPDLVFDDKTGTYVTPQLLDPEQFGRKFKSSWANTLLPLHPEYCKLLTYEKDSLALKWEKRFAKVETYAEAQARGFLNPTAVPGPPFSRYNLPSPADKDPLYVHPDSLMNYRQKDTITASLWVIAGISGHCKPGDITCVNSITDQTTFDPSWCEGDLDMAWRSFREGYLQIRRNILYERVLSGSCTGSFPTIHYSRWPSAQQLYDSAHQPQFFSINEAFKNNSDITNPYSENAVKADLQAYYDQTCRAYAELWMQQLEPCNYPASDIQNIIIPALVEVCKRGSDIDHPYGSRDIKPDTSLAMGQYRSFDDVINHYNATHPRDKSVCNADLITAPKPYNAQTVYSNKPVWTKPSDCECENLNTKKTEYDNYHEVNETFSGYLLRRYNTSIADAELNILLERCNQTTSCSFLATPINLPPLLQCYTGDICITCDQMALAYSEFTNTYGPIQLTLIETDTTQRNNNQLFANFMNNRLGFAKQAWEYLQFMQKCDVLVTQPQSATCDSFAGIINDFQCYYASLDDSVVFKGNCGQKYWTVYATNDYNTVSSTSDPGEFIQAGNLVWPSSMNNLIWGGASFNLIRNICVNNNFAFEFRVKNPMTGCTGSECGYGDIKFSFGNHSTNDGEVTVDEDFAFLLYPGSNSGFYDYRHTRHYTSALDNLNFNNWVTVKLVATDAAFKVYYNGNLILTVQRDGHSVIDQIGDLYFTLGQNHGRAIDWVKFYMPEGGADKLVYFEDFNNSLQLARPDVSNLCPKGECPDVFTNFYNERNGTEYTFSDLSTLYFNSCGKTLNVCNSNSSCDSFTSVISDFQCYYASLEDSAVHKGYCGQKYWALSATNDYNSFATTTDPTEFMQGGNLTWPSRMDSLLWGYTSFSLTRDLCVNNNFTFEFRVKNPMTGCIGTECLHGDVRFQFGSHSINDQYVNVDEDFVFMLFPGINSGFYEYRHVRHYQPELNNLSFDDWVNVKLVATDAAFKIYYNGNLILTVNRDGHSTIDKIGNFSFILGENHGRAIDWIKFYKPVSGIDKLVYFEDFNDPLHPARPEFADLCPKDNCTTSFTNFYNQRYGTQYSFTDLSNKYLSSCGKPLNICNSTTELLCGKSEPVFAPANPNEINNCSDSTFFAISAAQELYYIYQDSLKNNFDSLYLSKAMQAYKLESFTVSHPVSEYHYTLYFYDQAGSLIKTVPPEGVRPVRRTGWLDSVALARQNNLSMRPPHYLATIYNYNSLNQVVSQKSPDADVSRFYYDRLGRLVLSQNAKQADDKKYSYTFYDYLGRINEVGELENINPLSGALTRNPGQLASWLNAALPSRKQITKTWYDKAYPVDLDPYITQRNLRNRVSWTAWYSAASSNTDSLFRFATATFYSYDAHGNVDTLLQDYGNKIYEANVMNTYGGNRWKKIAYNYDLISGKVNWVGYQPGKQDAFYHRYTYDAENRLIGAETTNDSITWEKESAYFYYPHGPLAKQEIGAENVQNLNFAYTMQGWLKGVNSSAPFAWDMGRDGYGGTAYARDAFGYVLNYYEGDYEPISRSESNKPFAEMTGVPGFRGLYNGNIASMSVYLPKLGTPVLYNYSYDQLNRLTAMQPLTGLDTAGNQWNAIAINNYKENLGYDANGNILKYVRYGHNGNVMDNLTYLYNSKTNQLNQITDKIGANKFEGDIDNQNPNNYLYDKTGNLTKDVKEGIDSIYWNVYGKIASIKKKDTTITYSYDASGNRISKTVTKPGSSLTIWYVRDASGNVMSVYTRGDNTQNAGALTQTETHLYGSSRIGLFKPNNNVENPPVKSQFPLGGGVGYAYYQRFERGRKVYELSNHLGNVVTTVSDRRIALDADQNGIVDYYTADIVSQQDYYPFGMLMQGRSFSSSGYRYGFNGKEQDAEISGTGNQYDYGFRIYNPRIGRFLSVDPLMKNFPSWSPYPFAMNRPIDGIDLDGLEFYKANDSYIRMAINFNPQLNTISSTQLYRHWERQNNSNDFILPYKLNQIIDETKTISGIGSDASEVTRIRVYSELIFTKDQSRIEATDAESSFTNAQTHRLPIIPENKKELRNQLKTKEFFTPGISDKVDKANAIIAGIEIVGKLGQTIGEWHVNDIINEAQGAQSRKALLVLNGIKDSWQTIPQEYLNNSSLSKIANYLLYGEPITQNSLVNGQYPVDQKLTKVAKNIWEKIKPITAGELKKNLMSIENNRDNTSVSPSQN